MKRTPELIESAGRCTVAAGPGLRDSETPAIKAGGLKRKRLQSFQNEVQISQQVRFLLGS